MHKAFQIFNNAVPVIVMIGLIPFVQDDFSLSVYYLAIIALSFHVRYEKRDWIFLVFGFAVMTFSELFFIQSGVEVFNRTSLFSAMPLWLPLLWAYAFVAIRRSIGILDN